MGHRSLTQPLTIQQVRESTIPGGLVAHWERALVGQLARDTHAAGERFLEWPLARAMERQLTDDGEWLSSPKDTDVTHVVLTVVVVTEKRPD